MAPRAKTRPARTLKGSLVKAAKAELPVEGAWGVIRSFKKGIGAQFSRRCSAIIRKLYKSEKKNEVISSTTARDIKGKWVTALENWEEIGLMGNYISKSFNAKHSVILSLFPQCKKKSQAKNMISRAVRIYAGSRKAWNPYVLGEHQALLATVSDNRTDLSGFPASKLEDDSWEPASHGKWEYGQKRGELFSDTICRMKGRAKACIPSFRFNPNFNPTTIISACIDPKLIRLMLEEPIHESDEEILASIVNTYENTPTLIKD